LSATSADTAPQRGFFGHPRGLSTLFFTELWERFSYYGMKAILALYLYKSVAEGALGIEKSSALSLVAIYGSAVYMAGVGGGWLADRVLGSQRAVLYGGVLIMFGHIALALPIGLAGVYTGLVLIVLGTGLLKPNISSIVGGLYGEQDPKRDAGFSIFYMGINLGGFVAPLICGVLVEDIGWHAGFAAAAVGMFVGLVQYQFGRRHLGESANAPTNPLPEEHRGRVLGRIVGVTVAVIAVVALLVVFGVLGGDGVVNLLSVVSVVLPIGYFVVMMRSPKTTPVERDRLTAYIPLFVAYADTRVDNHLFGYEFPVPWFQSVNPIMIILLSPVFALIWVKMRDHELGTPRKFSGGLVFIGLAFLLAMVASQAGDPEHKVSPWWLVAMFFAMTCGELMLSPVGLSVTTKLAPRAFLAQTMGLFFLSIAAGQGIGAQVVKLYNDENAVPYFGILGAIAIGLGVLLLVFSPSIKKLMHGVD
jgi:POT family proton-dependent oligopeptide transporter